MNFYGLTNLIAAITNTVIGLFILIKGYKIRLCKIWGIFTLCVALYGWGAYKASGADSYESAFFWWQVSYVGVIMLPALFVDFVYRFLEIKRSSLVKVVYILCFLILATDILSKSLFIGHVSLKFNNSKWFTPAWWVYPPGPLHIFHTLVLYFGVLTYSVIKLIRAYKNSNSLKQIQIRYFVIAMILGFAGGGTSYLPCLNINVYPLFNLTVPIYTFIIAYAIIRHRLMDIEVIIKKTLVFAGLFAAALTVFILPLLLIQEFVLSRMSFGGRILSLSVSAVFIILTLEPLKNFLIRVTDKYLFQKKYDYNQTMTPYLDKIVTVSNLEEIIPEGEEILTKTLHPEISAILLLDQDKDKYIKYSPKGENNALVIANSSQIVAYLKSVKNILSIENDNDKKMSEEIKQEMLSLKAALAIPLMLRDDLIGIMVLGKKKSDEYYTHDDLSILTGLARTQAIAIKNAQLTKQIAQASEKKGVDKTSIGAAHQMKNILAEIKVDTEAMYFDVAYRYPNPDNVTLEQAKSFMIFTKEKLAKVLRQTDKGTGALDAILYPARARDDFALVDIPSVIKQAITSSSQIKSKSFLQENIPAPVVTNSIHENFPKIVGNEKLLEQTFQNLINNSFDAIFALYKRMKPEASYLGKITATAKDEGDKITISIEDNGLGMDDETKEKLFGGFYTTKSAGRAGHGAGLYIMQDWINQHKGRISFKTEWGKGTTFTIELPKTQEGFNGSKNGNT
ncbi:MAG: ATP-binding protein [Candidatus Omnitrophota bacterium]